MAIDLGDIYPLTINTTDSAGVPANVGAIALSITLPDDTVINPTPTNPATGTYQYDYPTTVVGRHMYRWLGTGLNSSAVSGVFDVWPAYAEMIVGLERAKRKLRITGTTEHDEDIREYIAASAAVIERHRREVVIRRTCTDVLSVHCARSLILPQTPVLSVTTVVSIDGVTTWDVADLHVDANSGIVRSRSGRSFSGVLEVTYRAGRTSIPENYTRAALIIVEHLWMTERPQQNGGAWPGAYEDSMEGVRVHGIGFAVPNRAIELLGSPPPLVA